MAIGSFLVAVVVGLTGMGGGALMTPMLVTLFGVPPLTAVSSDLVAVVRPVWVADLHRIKDNNVQGPLDVLEHDSSGSKK